MGTLVITELIEITNTQERLGLRINENKKSLIAVPYEFYCMLHSLLPVRRPNEMKSEIVPIAKMHDNARGVTKIVNREAVKMSEA